MEPAIKLIGAALTKNGKYKIFLESDDEAKMPMGAREIDADAARWLFPIPLNDKEDAQELESRLHKGLINGKHEAEVKILLQLITVDKLARIKLGHVQALKPTSYVPKKKAPKPKPKSKPAPQKPR